MTVHGPGSAGVPGAVAAWCEAHARFGRLPLAEVLAPSVDLAAGGFPVSAGLTDAVARQGERLQTGAPGWSALGAKTGSRLRQPELARTLEVICADGAAGFYTGPVAEAIAGAVRADDDRGIGTEDLAAYTVRAEAPSTGVYGPARLAVVPAPSQALLAVLALQALEDAPPAGTPEGEHAAIEAIKEVFELRGAVTSGANVQTLLSRPIRPAGPRASALRGPAAADHTAAVASADSDGLVVSMLVSVFHEFGSGVLVPDGGFLLNNRLSGLVGSEAGLADLPPGGRPGHTLSPMLLERDGCRLALATPGADGQVQTLVQILRRLDDTETGLSAALGAPRWRAVQGRLAVEASFDTVVTEALAARGHLVDSYPDGDSLFGSAAAAGLGAGGDVICASDPRREVWAAVR